MTLTSKWGKFSPVQISIDRITLNSAILVATFLAVLLLSSQSAASISSYLLCATMLWHVRSWSDVFSCPMVWPILLLLIYLPLTSFWSESFSWRDFASQMTRALLTFSFVVAYAECQLRGLLQSWLHRALAVAGAGVALLCILLFFVDPPEDGRLNGLGQLDTQVVAGLVFGVSALAVIHAALTDRRWPLALYAFLSLPLIAAVILTGSRGALVALSYGMVVLFGCHFVHQQRVLVVGLSLVAVCILGAIGLGWWSPEWREVFFPRGDSFRLLIWSETLARVADSPLIGLGILSVDDIEVENVVFHHPHNLYLSVLAQSGIVGLVLFLWMLIRVIRELFRMLKEPDAKFALAVLGLALPAYMLDGHELLDKVSDTWFLIWLPAAIALGLRWHRPYR